MTRIGAKTRWPIADRRAHPSCPEAGFRYQSVSAVKAASARGKGWTPPSAVAAQSYRNDHRRVDERLDPRQVSRNGRFYWNIPGTLISLLEREALYPEQLTYLLSSSVLAYLLTVAFSKQQSLNQWMDMLHQIYGRSQNYAKSEYEIHSHITEVCGAFGKYLFKKKDPHSAVEFLPKMFSWAVALLKKVKGNEANLEDIILTKYPRVCPYCVRAPCACWNIEKGALDADSVRNAYHRNSTMQGKSVNDFQLMFRSIYEHSWKGGLGSTSPDAYSVLLKLYSRLIEELAEIAEAMRLHHLYPSNFNNELADYFAWWFGLASSIHLAADGELQLSEDLLWQAYPGYCAACTLRPCDCRPGPVRELLSKPALNDLSLIDGLTQAQNMRAYEQDVQEASLGILNLATPVTCVRIDIDSFGDINDTHDHNAGDSALKHLVTMIRQKARPRDRLYRVGGDEFVLICPDLSSQEAEGMLGRIQHMLKARPVVIKGRDGAMHDIKITLSIGICTASTAANIANALSRADNAAIESKNTGKDRISIAEPEPA